MGQPPQHLSHRFLARPSQGQSRLNPAYLQLAESGQHLLLGREVVEEGAFADVGGFGDLLDRSGGKTLAGKEVEGRAQETRAEFRLVPGAAAQRWRGGGGRGGGWGVSVHILLLTI